LPQRQGPVKLIEGGETLEKRCLRSCSRRHHRVADPASV